MSYFLYFPSENVLPVLTPDQIHTLNYQISFDSFYNASQIDPARLPQLTSMTHQMNFSTAPQIQNRAEEVIPIGPQAPVVERQRRKRQKNVEKQIQSAKKNSESNLINHFFSYFNSRARSEGCVVSAIKYITQSESHTEKLVHLFYNTIHLVNSRRGRKYVNKTFFKTFFEPEKLSAVIPEIKDKIDKIEGVRLQEICEVFRRTCLFYYRSQSIDAILTSRRITNIAKQEHFRKRRKILKQILYEAVQK